MNIKEKEHMEQYIQDIEVAILEKDNSKMYDVWSRINAIYGEEVPKVTELYDEVKQYSGLVDRNLKTVMAVMKKHISDNYKEEQKGEETMELIIVAERFKSGLISRATGKGMDESEYKSDRETLMNSSVKKFLPRFVLTCQNTSAWWEFIKHKFPSYNERRIYINTEFEKLFLELENPSDQSTMMIKQLKERIDSEYLRKQTDLMLEMQRSNPTEAIGKAKELIETICKTILEDHNETYTKNDDINALMDKVVGILSLSPRNISDAMPLSKTLKQILGSLRAISGGLAELRNPYGAGHGKAASYKGLEERHAKLAVGSSITLVNFLWDSHELKKGENKRSKQNG